VVVALTDCSTCK